MENFYEIALFYMTMPIVSCCVSLLVLCNKLLQVCQLETTPFYDLTIAMGLESGMALVGSLHGVSQGYNHCVARAAILSEAQGPLSSSCDFCQNPLSCSCRTHGSLLLQGQLVRTFLTS